MKNLIRKIMFSGWIPVPNFILEWYYSHLTDEELLQHRVEFSKRIDQLYEKQDD